MNDIVSSETDLSGLPEPVVRTAKRHFSIVWLVPVIAALIGGWLIYKALSEKGPEVSIIFKTAEGIEVGKTKIRYKEVEIGQVTGLSLTPDLSHVVVKAEFVREATTYLTENTRFWVAKARVGTFGVSGLSTLFSGAYIDVDPGMPGKPQLEFTGLEEPPLVTTVDPGRVFILQAARKGSIEIGAPIFYRQIMVGKVIAYNLAKDGSNKTFHLFINAPFQQYV
jgi:paraquat-inducible protein B